VEDYPGSIVLTDITKHPKYGGKIDPDYQAMLATGFAARGPVFRDEFLRTTFLTGKIV
jgi:hypothetical protein